MTKNITEVFLGIRKLVMKTIATIVPPDDIEDIVQETYVKLCLIKSEETIEHPRSFMLKIAKNLALDHQKKASSRLNDSIDELNVDDIYSLKTGEDPTFDCFASDQEFSQFCETVRKLPVQCRKVFVLKKVYGYSQKEIAESLNLSVNTVEVHIANGLRRCNKIRAVRNTQSTLFQVAGKTNE